MLDGVFDLMLDAPSSGAARLRPAGHLDDTAARELLHAAAAVVRGGCSCLVLDLDGLTSWDCNAAFAVVGCTRLSRWLPDGVDVVAESPAGQALAAHAGVLPEQAPDTMAACHAC